MWKDWKQRKNVERLKKFYSREFLHLTFIIGMTAAASPYNVFILVSIKKGVHVSIRRAISFGSRENCNIKIIKFFISSENLGIFLFFGDVLMT
jgi:hypothetical protein